MKRATKKSPRKKPVRKKSTGAGAPMVVRMHDPQIKEIDAWIGDSDISRPEAIRQLVNWALSQTKPQQPDPPEEPPLSIVKRARENELRR